VNKAELIEAVAVKVGDVATARNAVEAALDAIVRAVTEGDVVRITGFGTIEARIQAARTTRNPATGGQIHLPATKVPRFRPGTNFKDLVAGRKPLPAIGNAAAKAPKTPRP
jgi:DNA-binding protein HU-beta